MNIDLNEPIRTSDLSGIKIAMFFGAFGLSILTLAGLTLFIARKTFEWFKI
ncbi:hypothetical protein [Shewanella psychrotolerans]|uniref:hypothetical protein n=1 Tax=Shewanella psychrotolerans TaxID=2864206 RepID=UPI001C6550AB|nr:hypothetical protein [Shewanella psychrotolerans]QYK00792.1 hypothetical protein K0I62_15560 [Shewanella psychrotolerans]